MKNIIFIAPPAAGKGTQSTRLCNEFGFEHISTGDLLREEVKNGNSELQKIMESGSLVSDEIILSILNNKLQKSGYILDGFPRNLNQAIALDKMLENINSKIDYVIYLSLDKETAKKRIVGRISCPNCGSVYNTMIDDMNSKNENVCDLCSSILVKRKDDNEETFNKRFETYLEETKPIISYYEKKGILYQVDSSKPTDQVYKDIKSIICD